MAKNKKTFEVLENETLSDCIKRMEMEGYVPTKRMEKPVFEEIIINGVTEYKPISRKIVFEGKKID